MESRIAEKLVLLNERGQGLLIRLYNVKKDLNGDKKPSFLSDKQLDPIIKAIVRRFPTLDNKPANVTAIEPIRAEILRSFQDYYDTFEDVMEFKFTFNQFLTYIDTCKMYMDITVNFDLTRLYLDLVVTYISMMIIMDRIEERKLILGMYSFAAEMGGKKLESFGRVGQAVVEFEPLFAALSNQLKHHSKRIIQAILSVSNVYKQRSMSATQRRQNNFLSLLAHPGDLTKPAESNTIACEYLSMATMERWITFGLLFCYKELNITEVNEIWKLALNGGYNITLCRDEVINIHVYTISCLERIKGFGRKAAEVKDIYQKLCSSMPKSHKDQRIFLRSALKELVCVFTDRPGLLGPKILELLKGLSVARDEVEWLMKHKRHLPSKKINVKYQKQNFEDRYIPELLFMMEQLRDLVFKYRNVITKYYGQYLRGYDAGVLNNLQEGLKCDGEESTLLDGISLEICEDMIELSDEEEEEKEGQEKGDEEREVEKEARHHKDYRGLRLDWLRLQALMSCDATKMLREEIRQLCRHLNTVMFHTRLLDGTEKLLDEVSSLRLYCFYTGILTDQFGQCIEYLPQQRYSIVFPRICSYFMKSCHELCPEERPALRKGCVDLASRMFIKLFEHTTGVITQFCQAHADLADKVLPKNAVQHLTVRKKSRKKSDEDSIELPGHESSRKNNTDTTRMDKLFNALTELCWAINYYTEMRVWGHKFYPIDYFRAYFTEELQKIVLAIIQRNPETRDVCKPSEVKAGMDALNSFIIRLENHLFIESNSPIQLTLMDNSQLIATSGSKNTLTRMYARWYVEVFLLRVSTGVLIYSPHHGRFVNMSSEVMTPHPAEQYADYSEMHALASLIGPYGMNVIRENTMANVSTLLKKLVTFTKENGEILKTVVENLCAPVQLREVTKRLTNLDNAVLSVVRIGAMLCFYDTAQEALSDVLTEKASFITEAIEDLVSNNFSEQDNDLSQEMLANAAGLPRPTDPLLKAVINPIKTEFSPLAVSILIAVAIPKLARGEFPSLKLKNEDFSCITHCLAKGLAVLVPAMWSVHEKADPAEQLLDFIAIASHGLLQIITESERPARYADAVISMIGKIVEESAVLSHASLKSCLPYSLLQSSYYLLNKQL